MAIGALASKMEVTVRTLQYYDTNTFERIKTSFNEEEAIYG